MGSVYRLNMLTSPMPRPGIFPPTLKGNVEGVNVLP